MNELKEKRKTFNSKLSLLIDQKSIVEEEKNSAICCSDLIGFKK